MQPPRAPQRLVPWRFACFLAAAALASLGVLALIVAAALLARPLAERLVIRAASERGIALVPGTLTLGLHQIVLEGATVRLIGVPGVSARARRVAVDLERFTPVGVEASGVDVQVEGSVAVLALDLAEWTRVYSRAYAGKLEAHDVTLRWRERADATEWLSMQGGTVRPRPGGGELSATEAHLGGVPLGRVATAWNRTEAEVEIGFGAETAGKAPVRLKVEHAAAEPKAFVTLRPTAIERLGKPFGVVLPLPGVTVSGEAELILPAGVRSGPVTGKLDMTLEGWVPPHPPELNGFVFGKKTRFETGLHVTPDRKLARLDESRVTAGAFVLKGSGSIQRLETHALIGLALRGSLRCTDLAGAAAESRLGRTIGRWVGTQARNWVGGSVGVEVRVQASSADLSKAKLTQTIGVGCGLRPIAVPGLGELDLGDIGIRLDRLPSLPSALPPVPSTLSFPIQGSTRLEAGSP